MTVERCPTCHGAGINRRQTHDVPLRWISTCSTCDGYGLVDLVDDETTNGQGDEAA